MTPTKTATRWALASLSLSMLMPSLDTSIANVALPTLAQAFGASFQAVQWVVLAYLLAITTLIVSAGRLGDIFGRRRLLLGGIGLFTLASLVCGLATQLAWLIAARAVQGLGAALMMALTIAMVSETVSKARTGSAMGLLGTMSAIGTTTGPSLGGIMITALGWQSLFLVNVPLGVLNLWLAFRFLPADPPRTERPRLDIPGTVLLALTLGTLALAMTGNIALLLITGMGALLFVVVQARVASPLIQLTLFRDAGLSTGLVMNALVATVMMATLVVGPFYLSGTLNLNTATVGFVMSIGPLISMVSGVVAGRIVDRMGAARVRLFGLAVMIAGAFGLAFLPGLFGVAGYIAAIVLLTPGYQLFQAANTTAIMLDVAAGQRGVVSGLVSLSRNLGLIIGASFMGAVFALAGLQVTFAVAAGLIGVALILTRYATRVTITD